MIWNSIISVVTALLIAIVSLFPYASATVLTSINEGLTPFKTFLTNANWLFPVYEFFNMIIIILGVEATILLIRLIMWVAKNLSAGFIKD